LSSRARHLKGCLGGRIILVRVSDRRSSEINIRPFPEVSATRIPVARGEELIFSHDGFGLFFFDGQGISAAPVSYEPTLHVRRL
jgi:hypothetical protein